MFLPDKWFQPYLSSGFFRRFLVFSFATDWVKKKPYHLYVELIPWRYQRSPAVARAIPGAAREKLSYNKMPGRGFDPGDRLEVCPLGGLHIRPREAEQPFGEIALIKLINFNRVGPGVVRSNNCRGLLITPGEDWTSALWLCRLSQGAFKRAMEISAFSCSCKGNTRPHTVEIVLLREGKP